MSRKKKILIVEDEGIVAIDIRNIIRNLGYDCIELAFTGEKAIKPKIGALTSFLWTSD